METETKRNQITLGELVTVGVSLVIIGLVFTFGIDIVTDVRDDFTANTIEYNNTNDTSRAMGEIPKKLPTIALIIAVAVIITILTRAFLKAR